MSIFHSLQVRANNLVQGSLNEKIVFLHVPKCGGNSIAAAIYDRYKTFSPRGERGLINISAAASLKTANSKFGPEPFKNDFFDVLQFRELLLGYFMNLNDTRLISGHICFSDIFYEEFKSQYAFVTVLREPVKRWISAFFYNKYRDESEWNIRDDILAYMDSDRGKANGHEYVKKLLGRIDADIDYTTEEAIETAKKNLAKFAVVGLLEDIDGFKKKFKDRFGVELAIGKKNKGPKSADYMQTIITPEIEEQIQDICRPDQIIYQHVIDNF